MTHLYSRAVRSGSSRCPSVPQPQLIMSPGAFGFAGRKRRVVFLSFALETCNEDIIHHHPWSGARLMRRGDGGPRRRIQWQPPSGGSGFKSFLGKTAKFLITGTVFYIGVAFVTGGTSRLQSDANIIKVGPSPEVGLVVRTLES